MPTTSSNPEAHQSTLPCLNPVDLWFSMGGVGGRAAPRTQWAEARDAAEHSTMHGTAATTKNYPYQTVTRAGVEIPLV